MVRMHYYSITMVIASNTITSQLATNKRGDETNIVQCEHISRFHEMLLFMKLTKPCECLESFHDHSVDYIFLCITLA